MNAEMVVILIIVFLVAIPYGLSVFLRKKFPDKIWFTPTLARRRESRR